MIAELPNLGVVKIEGADSTAFLQAHFCNDVALLAENATQLSGYCNPKGRLQCVFHLYRLPSHEDRERLLAVAPEEVLGKMTERLSMFAKMAKPAGKEMFAKVTRTDVTLTDCSDSLKVLGVAGPSVETVVSSGSGSMDDSSDDWPDLLALNVGGGMPSTPGRKLLVGTAPALQRCRESMPNTSISTEEEWRLLDIRAGLPDIVTATQDSFVPQMVNFQLIGGLSFTKGCYPGQEIVARMQYLGTLKRRMERASAAVPAVEPGTIVQDKDGAQVGEVVMAANTESGSEMLVVMRITALGAPAFLPGDAQVQFLPLPYDFEEIPDTGS